MEIILSLVVMGTIFGFGALFVLIWFKCLAATADLLFGETGNDE